MLRTHDCGELRESHVGTTVKICGWASSIRNHGQLRFIAMRDRYGLTQVVIDDPKLLETRIPRESTLLVSGMVRMRPEETQVDDYPTGKVELYAEYIEVLGLSEVLPIEVDDRGKLSDEVRLKHRYLDLRRPCMLEHMIKRHQIVESIRQSFNNLDFIEIEPPMLVKPTPEGSRDFVVPSRLYPGKAYALPQSPQLYKQLLMIAGVDRYFSFPRCFRDEDPRRGRQLVHTQIDFEMSFAEEEDIFGVVETFLSKAFKDVLDIDLPTPFPRFTYKQSLDRWGLDKPDLRFGMELIDLSDTAGCIDYTVFTKTVQSGGCVKGIIAPKCSGYSRKQLSDLENYVKGFGAHGLAWVKCSAGQISASFDKHCTPEQLLDLSNQAGLAEGDLLLVIAGSYPVTSRSLGELRNFLAKTLDLIPSGIFKPLWVTDFPMFEYDDDSKAWVTMHHMFTLPKKEFVDSFEQHPERTLGHLYDVVLNGVELGSGSLRITSPDLQRKVMDFVGYPQEKANENFGFLLNAYRYGAPPHAGMGLGLDNLVMLMLGKTSLLDVIAFPNNSSGIYPMDDSPSYMDEQVLKELHITPEKRDGKE